MDAAPRFGIFRNPLFHRPPVAPRDPCVNGSGASARALEENTRRKRSNVLRLTDSLRIRI